MLPKHQRLDRRSFSNAFSSGRKVSDGKLTLSYSPSPTFRASVVTPKSIAPHAVERNRMRRALYRLIGTLSMESLHTGTYIFIVRSKFENSDELRPHLEALIARATSARTEQSRKY